MILADYRNVNKGNIVNKILETLAVQHRIRFKSYTNAMADLSKFIRSREKLTEVLRHLMHKSTDDERTVMYISHLQKSIKVIDHKMEQLRQKAIN